MRYFSENSIKELAKVDSRLVAVVALALGECSYDFAVVDGFRTKEEQQRLVDSGASRILLSRHLEGKAVDLAPYINGKIRWEIPAVCQVAYAMRAAAKRLNITLRWGGVWDKQLNEITSNLETEIENYTLRQKEKGRTAFIDAVHFELTHDQ